MIINIAQIDFMYIDKWMNKLMSESMNE